jgi:hypothetical protein
MVTQGKATSVVWLKDRQEAIRADLALDGTGPRVEILDENRKPVLHKS